MAIILLHKAVKIVNRELRLYPIDETGGVLFGVKVATAWIVCTVLPSGQKSTRSAYSFSMDREEMEREASKVINGSILPMKVLGIWHKHNHDLAPHFSDADIETNSAYARINPFGAISVLATKKGATYCIRGFRVGRDGEHSSEKIYLLKCLQRWRGKDELPVLQV